jgi:hypothetical protein
MICRIYFFACCFLAMFFPSCQIDNYEKPTLTLRGKIVDSQSGEPVQSGGINSGSIVKLYEGSSAQPLNLSTYPDGTFINQKVFSGSYSLTAEGPFTLVSQERLPVDLSKDTEVEIKVVPNLRVKATLISSTTNSATVKLQYERVNKTQALSQIGLAWSTYPNPNMLVFAGGKTILENITDQSVADAGEKVFTLTGLLPNTTYYVRGASRTVNPGNFYNYSPQFEIKTK